MVLLFYDSIRRPPMDGMPPVLNSSSFLLKGIEKHFKKQIPIVGAGLIGDFDFNFTRQFCGSYAGAQKAVGTLLDGDFNVYTRITHGCTPLDGIYYKITRMEGSVIYELDNKPITDIIDNIYGTRRWREQKPVKLLTIGVNCGDRYDLVEESICVNRLILGFLPNGEGISIFESDLETGTSIRFMVRDTDEMMRSARINAEGIMEEIIKKGERPVFGLYIDCAGRSAEYQNIISEEAEIIQDVFSLYGVQLFGFYSGVEVAPMPVKSRGLDWTGVLLVFSEGKK
jgi:small ligand-binding sensory domain FIST